LKSISDKPVLIIPVYKGGELFRECYASVVGKESGFEMIFISLNGTSAGRAADLETLKSFGKPAENVLLLETPTVLPSFDHQNFLIDAVSKRFSDERLVMSLFHDDNLLRPPSRDESQPDSVILGDWQNLVEGGLISALKKSPDSPTNWIRSFAFQKITTNGSGMVVPLGVMRDVSLSLQRWRTGVRYEYLLCTHSSVKSLCAAREPLVSLRIHEMQDGANVDLPSFVRGEAMFMSWLVDQKRAVGLSGLGVLAFLGLALAKNSSVRLLGLFANQIR